MILESILVVTFALILDLIVGDPKNKFHPTSWIGTLIAKILVFLNIEINNIPIEFIASIVSVVVGVILLKTTIAIRGMEKHAMAVMLSIEKNDLEAARTNLSMIVKRKTKDLDKNHLLSGTLE